MKSLLIIILSICFTYTYGQNDSIRALTEELKIKVGKTGDSLVIDKYGKVFFDKYLSLHDISRGVYRTKNRDTTTRISYNVRQVGFWDDKWEKIPNAYVLVYEIKFNDTLYFLNPINIHLDSTLSPIVDVHDCSKFMMFNDRPKISIDSFYVTPINLIETSEVYGVLQSDSIYTKTDLVFTQGHFIYTISQTISSRVLEGVCFEKCKTEIITIEYEINAVTFELLKKQKFRNISHWNRGCGGGDKKMIHDFLK